MKFPHIAPLCLSFLLAATSQVLAADAAGDPTPPPSERASPANPLLDRYIIEVIAGADPASVAASHGVAPHFVYQHAVRGFAGMVPPGRVAALRSDARVLRVTPDRQVTAIGKPTGGGGGGGSGEILPEGVKRINAAPGDAGHTGEGVGVAVVDTGVDFNHADLLTSSSSYSAFPPSAQDNNGHGTHVAGIIAAKDNTRDVVGVAPGATIYAVKVLDAAGVGSDSSIIAGLDWVLANAIHVNPQIKVVNMSLGRAGSDSDNFALHDAIYKLYSSGVTVVVAAGNDATLEISQQVPAAYQEVMAIASTTAKAGLNQYKFFKGVINADTASYFTSDGAGVAVSAPGEDQENITRAGFIQSVGILSTKLGGGTTRMSGTSMAAPHVAGVVALIYEKDPAAKPDAIRSRIIASATNDAAPLDSPSTNYSSDGVLEGIVDAKAALTLTPSP